MKSPTLSIIIPIYNVEEYIERCINSVLSQTFKDYELLLIDDGSTDSSGDICKKFAATDLQKIHYIYKDNEGQGPARDLGVKLAKGEYITFLDADDWWLPDFCEEMINTIIKFDTDIVVCDINYVEENSHGPNITVSQIRLPEYKKIIPREFPDTINRMRTFLWGKIFRRSLYTESGLRQAGHKYQDFPVTTALVALSQSVCRVPLPLYFYNRSRNNSTINHASALKFIQDSIRDLADNFIKLNLFEYYYKYLEKMAFSQVRFAINRMDYLVPTEHEEFKKSIKYDLFKVMKNYFPNWVNPSEVNVCVSGSNTLKKIVSTFLYKDADIEIDSDKKYAFIFIDLLDGNTAISKGNYINIDTDNFVIVRLLETGSEKILNSRYDELTEYLQPTITIFPEKICNSDRLMDESAIWNTADQIWYKLFS